MSCQIPRGVQHGQLLVLRRKGLPRHGFLVNHGDQYVRFRINLPTALNPKQRALLEEFAEEEIKSENEAFMEGDCASNRSGGFPVFSSADSTAASLGLLSALEMVWTLLSRSLTAPPGLHRNVRIYRIPPPISFLFPSWGPWGLRCTARGILFPSLWPAMLHHWGCSPWFFSGQLTRPPPVNFIWVGLVRFGPFLGFSVLNWLVGPVGNGGGLPSHFSIALFLG
ncbi:Chaperone protein dnaJ 1, mitochondrial [Linum perenne]